MRLRTTFLVGRVIGAGVALALAKSNPPLPTVSHVDLNRYAGRWYEIARYPNRFERKCISDVTATYTALADGKIRVVNLCLAYNGTVNRSEGIATIANKQTNAKLKVTFFWPFSGNYWIIALGDEYEYAVVGEPSRKYLWILSRDPHMEEGLYQRLLTQIKNIRYDPDKLSRTKQSEAAAFKNTPVLKKTGTDDAKKLTFTFL